MHLLVSSLLAALLTSQVTSQSSSSIDYSQYVNAFIGSEGPTPGQAYGGGDIFVGGARPFGVVKFGIDTTAANWTLATLNGGWTPDGNVTAFSERLFSYPRQFVPAKHAHSDDARKRHWRRAQIRYHPTDAIDVGRCAGECAR
jgi:hypothetical protein